MRIIKRLLVGFAVLLALVGAAVLFSFWDASRNRGWEFGYYEEYNRMRHLLLEIPGVVIVNEQYTHDIVLEEFEFALLVPANRSGSTSARGTRSGPSRERRRARISRRGSRRS